MTNEPTVEVRAYFSDQFVLPLPDGHRFPMAKYRLLRERVLADGVLAFNQLDVAEPIDESSILRVHTREYWSAVRDGRLDRKQQRAMGFPWSPAMVERSRRSVGATLQAAKHALSMARCQQSTDTALCVGINLAGGTHHAFADRGEGFCVLNDVAIAFRRLQSEGRVDSAIVIDCDVHQGNGTAAIFTDDASCFTFSVHGSKNYPFRKETSDLDVALPDGCADEQYLVELEEALHEVDARNRNRRPSRAKTLVFYLAGADPFEGDRLGRLALSKDGLAARDRMVLKWCRDRRLPVVIVMAGGYAEEVADVVDIHAATIRTACRLAKPGKVWTAVEGAKRVSAAGQAELGE